MKDQPILICYWFDAGSSRTVDAVIRRSQTPADVRVAKVETPVEFLQAIADWYESSNNTQHLIVVSHGIHDENLDEWIGLGLGSDDGQFLPWNELWDAVVRPRRKPPRLVLLGCCSSEAADHLQSSLTPRWNNPPIIGLSAVVSEDTMLSVNRAAVQLLSNMSNLAVTLDTELDTLRPIFADVRMHHSVRLARRRPRYVDVDVIEQETHMTYREYLEWENQEIRREVERRNERRRKRGC